MTHLRIENQNNNVEVINAAIIQKVYEKTLDIILNEGDVSLKGNLLADYARLTAYNYLTGNLPDTSTKRFPNLSLNITGGVYIDFIDPEVERVLTVAIGDGIGVTTLLALLTTTLAQDIFMSNTTIITLNDLLNFTSLTSIGLKFANGCTNLQSIIVPASVITLSPGNYSNFGAFRGCTSLSSVTLNEGLLVINNRAFMGCTALTQITIPSTVTALGPESGAVFRGCSNLTNVYGGLGITSVCAEAFMYCSSLSNANFLTNTTYIGDNAFRSCGALTSADLSSALTICPNAFRECSNLATVTDSSNVTSIGSSAFWGCSKLTSIDLSNVTSLGSDCLARCSLLSNIGSLNSSLTTIPNSLFDTSPLVTAITPITLPNVTVIGDNAFKGCASLFTTLSLPSCTTIGSSAFLGCTSLTSIDLSNVTTFGSGCFLGCSSLGVGVDLDFNLDGKSFSSNCFKGTGYRSITLHETSYHLIYNFSGSGLFGTFGATMPNLVKLDLSDTKLTIVDLLYSDNLTTIILPETYTNIPNRGSEWGRSLLYVVILSTTPTSNMEIPDYYFTSSNLSSIYVPDSAYQDYYDVLITNSSTPISSTRLKRISELPSSVTWYTKEHPSTT